MKKVIPGTLLLAGLLTATWFTACNSFSTLKDATDADGKLGEVSVRSKRVSGLIYYLPKGKIRITGDFKPSSPAPSSPDVAAKAVSPSTGSARSAVAAGDAPGADSTEQKNFFVTIAVEVEPDPTARYYLKPDRNYFYDDDIRLTVNSKHLLSTGNATAEDQTAKIISTSASLAAQVAGLPAPGKVSAFFAERGKLTVNGLLALIQDAINKGKASKSTTLPGPALLNVPKALGDFPSERQTEGKAFFGSLQNQDAVTLGSIMELIRFYLPEAATKQIQTNEAPEFFDQLYAALSPKYVPARPFSVVFDPARGEPDDLSAYGFIVTVTPQPQAEIKLLEKIWGGKNKDVAHGIAFRAVRPYRIDVKSVANTYFYINESRLLLLPDTIPDHTLLLDYSRLAFVKKTTNIGFVDGIPQTLGQTAPSPVLGFLAIPKGIIQAIVPLPSKALGGPSGVQAPGVSGTSAAPTASPIPVGQ